MQTVFKSETVLCLLSFEYIHTSESSLVGCELIRCMWLALRCFLFIYKHSWLWMKRNIQSYVITKDSINSDWSVKSTHVLMILTPLSLLIFFCPFDAFLFFALCGCNEWCYWQSIYLLQQLIMNERNDPISYYTFRPVSILVGQWKRRHRAVIADHNRFYANYRGGHQYTVNWYTCRLLQDPHKPINFR